MNLQQMVTNTPNKHTKMAREKANVETRTLKELKEEFISKSGDFDDFHKGMNGREKLLFKGWIQEMRREVTENFTQ